MQFPLPIFFEWLLNSYSTAKERAVKDNFRIEERLSEARVNSFIRFLSGKLQSSTNPSCDFAYWNSLYRQFFTSNVACEDNETFRLGEVSSLNKQRSPNDWLIRIEHIDNWLAKYNKPVNSSAKSSVKQRLQSWCEDGAKVNASQSPSATKSLKDLGNLLGKKEITPELQAEVKNIIKHWNTEREDYRPSFVAFAAEFKDELSNNDILSICQRLGLGHLFGKGKITLAIMRYQVRDVIKQTDQNSFIAPTVLDASDLNPYFHPGAKDCDWGFAVHLEQNAKLALSSELLHKRIDYLPEHLHKIVEIELPALDEALLAQWRDQHLEKLRHTCGRENFGQLV